MTLEEYNAALLAGKIQPQNYNDYVTLAYAKGSDPSLGAVGTNGIADAYGSAYASPDRYNTYQSDLRSFMSTQQDQDINAYLDAHPEYLDEVQQRLQQDQAGAGWGENYNPTSLMQAVGSGTPREAAYQALLQTTYTPPGNPMDYAGSDTTPMFQSQDPYQAWRNTLTPSQQAEYDQVAGAKYSKGTSTGRGGFLAVLAAMTGGAALAAEAGAGAAAGAVGSIGGELTAGLTAQQIAALGEGIAGSSAGAAGLGGAFSGIAPELFTGAGVVGSGASALPEANMADWYLNAAGQPMTSAEYAALSAEAASPLSEVAAEQLPKVEINATQDPYANWEGGPQGPMTETIVPPPPVDPYANWEGGPQGPMTETTVPPPPTDPYSNWEGGPQGPMTETQVVTPPIDPSTGLPWDKIIKGGLNALPFLPAVLAPLLNNGNPSTPPTGSTPGPAPSPLQMGAARTFAPVYHPGPGAGPWENHTRGPSGAVNPNDPSAALFGYGQLPDYFQQPGQTVLPGVPALPSGAPPRQITGMAEGGPVVPTYTDLMAQWQPALRIQENTPPNAEHFAATDKIKDLNDQMYGLGKYAGQGPATGAQQWWNQQDTLQGQMAARDKANFVNSNGQMGSMWDQQRAAEQAQLANRFRSTPNPADPRFNHMVGPGGGAFALNQQRGAGPMTPPPRATIPPIQSAPWGSQQGMNQPVYMGGSASFNEAAPHPAMQPSEQGMNQPVYMGGSATFNEAAPHPAMQPSAMGGGHTYASPPMIGNSARPPGMAEGGAVDETSGLPPYWDPMYVAEGPSTQDDPDVGEPVQTDLHRPPYDDRLPTQDEGPMGWLTRVMASEKGMTPEELKASRKAKNQALAGVGGLGFLAALLQKRGVNPGFQSAAQLKAGLPTNANMSTQQLAKMASYFSAPPHSYVPAPGLPGIVRTGGKGLGYAEGGQHPTFNSAAQSHVDYGNGGGQDDRVQANLSPGEYVMDADVVSALGDGSNAAGAKALDAMRQRVREHKRGAPADSIPPRAKSPLEYFRGGR